MVNIVLFYILETVNKKAEGIKAFSSGILFGQTLDSCYKYGCVCGNVFILAHAVILIVIFQVKVFCLGFGI